MAVKKFKPWPRRRRNFRGSFRTEPTPEEKAKIDAVNLNAKQIRALGTELNRAAYDLRKGVHTCILASEAGWPYNPDRLQKVLEAADRILRAKEKGKGL